MTKYNVTIYSAIAVVALSGVLAIGFSAPGWLGLGGVAVGAILWAVDADIAESERKR